MDKFTCPCSEALLFKIRASRLQGRVSVLRAVAGRCLFELGIACSVVVSIRYVISHANMSLKLHLNCKIHTMPTDCSGNSPVLKARDEQSRGFNLQRPVALNRVGQFVSRLVSMLFSGWFLCSCCSDHPPTRI